MDMDNEDYSPLSPSIEASVIHCNGDFFQKYNYQPLRWLYKGRLSEVLKAQDTNGDLKAVKMLSKEKVGGVSYKCFVTEVSILQHMKHENIITGIQAFDCPMMYIITMPFYHHKSLENHLTTLTNEDIDCYLLQLTSAVNYIHTRHVAHRDIKPHNVLLSGDGSAILSDFGLACVVTSVPMVMEKRAGTVAYMSPEVLKGHLGTMIDYYKSDTYSLGLTLWSMVTQKKSEPGLDHLAHLSPQGSSPGPYRCFLDNLLHQDPEARWDTNQLASELVKHHTGQDMETHLGQINETTTAFPENQNAEDIPLCVSDPDHSDRPHLCCPM